MASTNRWLLQSVFEKSVILKEIAIYYRVRSVFLKNARRMHLFEPAMKRDRYPYLFIGEKFVLDSIFLSFSWSLNTRQNEKDLFTLFY